MIPFMHDQLQWRLGKMETVTSFLTDNSSCMCAVGIVVTILAIAVSTRYSLRNLFNISPVSGDEVASESSDVRTREEMCDIAGNDGDDEAEIDEDDIDLDDKDGDHSTHSPLSPRYPDPVDYCEHIQGEFKRVKQTLASRTIQKELTDEQIQQERDIQQKQLSEIFRLMQEQQERFGISSMEDMQEQMKLYTV